MLIRNEASSLPKESHGRGANIYEFLGQAYEDDLIFNPYVSVRGEEHKFPEVWLAFWFSITLTFYKLQNYNFWEQGRAFIEGTIPNNPTESQRGLIIRNNDTIMW